MKTRIRMKIVKLLPFGSSIFTKTGRVMTMMIKMCLSSESSTCIDAVGSVLAVVARCGDQPESLEVSVQAGSLNISVWFLCSGVPLPAHSSSQHQADGDCQAWFRRT